ncbi:HK97 family phage prohead protease [Marinilactibacillus sp. Marseille-P9653]|uniref:HK97 family phage prohead protease n=1 Tax=Marinilactibacillus sp. Marseille-P9653 TaxID=2866583 RepID=UPI001CE4113B|nr:HK97 family phage prohead protease [Marinilactibacillus sp. Marseille-P9653]
MTKLEAANKQEYRSVALLGTTKESEGVYKVEGYATTFNRYELFESDGIKYYEQIDRNAFVGADMSDVIMQYDHEGRVLARKTNGTLTITPNQYGLFIKADLSKSSAGKELHKDITSGLVTKMSWAFTVAEDSYDKDTRTRIIKRIKKVYDVSAVSIPANDQTSISVESHLDGETRKRANERRRTRLRLQVKLLEMEFM